MIYPTGRKLAERSGVRPLTLEFDLGLDHRSSATYVADCSDAQFQIATPAHREQVAQLIHQRLEARLPGRIRGLKVLATENAVVLEGQCSTFYTKQLAQHVAMGVLEYEQLINNICVLPAK